jgi:hypothetical protein
MSDLKTVLINDSRIEDISGDISFAVMGGAQQYLSGTNGKYQFKFVAFVAN